jgi:hypothetical protein
MALAERLMTKQQYKLIVKIVSDTYEKQGSKQFRQYYWQLVECIANFQIS